MFSQPASTCQTSSTNPIYPSPTTAHTVKYDVAEVRVTTCYKSIVDEGSRYKYKTSWYETSISRQRLLLPAHFAVGALLLGRRHFLLVGHLPISTRHLKYSHGARPVHLIITMVKWIQTRTSFRDTFVCVCVCVCVCACVCAYVCVCVCVCVCVWRPELDGGLEAFGHDPARAA